MDDSGGFDHWEGDDDDDDFGMFTSADDSNISTPGKSEGWNTVQPGTEDDMDFTFAKRNQSGAADIQGNIPSTADSGISDFANFDTFHNQSVSNEAQTINLDSEKRPKTIDLDSHEEENPTEAQKETIKHSLSDSGLYSSDVSPVIQSDLSASGNKSNSDSESVEDLQLNVRETTSDKTSFNSENLSNGKDNNSYIKDENNYRDQELVDSLEASGELNQGETRSDTDNNSDWFDEAVRSNYSDEASDAKRAVPECIPQVENSSHSFDDSTRLQTSSLHESDSTSGKTSDAVFKENSSEKDHEDIVMHADKEMYDSKISDEEEPHIDDSFGQKEEDQTSDEHNLSQISNNDSEIDSDYKSSLLNQCNADSIQNETKIEIVVNDSGQSKERESLDLGSNEEHLDDLGSCNNDQENLKSPQENSDISLYTDHTNEPDEFERTLEIKSSDPDEGELTESLERLSVTDQESCHMQKSGDPLSDQVNLCDEELNELDEDEFAEFSTFKSENNSEPQELQFGKSDDSDIQFKSESVTKIQGDEFGDFSDAENSFAAFEGETFSQDVQTTEQSDNWAAFSEPQISEAVATSEVDDEEWASFGAADDDDDVSQKEDSESVSFRLQQASLQNMSKQDKVLFAVTGSFSTRLTVADTELEQKEDDILEMNAEKSDSDIWYNMKGLKTTNALAYHWSHSQWNDHLYQTLKVDTRNILFGHKKSSSVPIFASGLTMLEPTKGPVGSSTRSHDTLIDTTKSDESQVYTQDTIPPAQFDWSSSGLTNPLEEANKTLNLDFLIQESEQTSGKSHALESEFLGVEDSTSHKPATIQPLENILANLKTSSTFKPTNQNEDLSQEASRIIQSLPNLAFMKTNVLMFPLKMNE